MASKIILVGMMGAGKTTIGKLLSNKIGYDFIDLDKIIEEKSGVKINTIFEIEGESGFRDRELQVLSDSLEMDKVIISTGGGIVTNEKSRAQLTKHKALIIYLKANLQTLCNRLKNDNSRPILNVDDMSRVIPIHYVPIMGDAKHRNARLTAKTVEPLKYNTEKPHSFSNEDKVNESYRLSIDQDNISLMNVKDVFN